VLGFSKSRVVCLLSDQGVAYKWGCLKIDFNRKFAKYCLTMGVADKWRVYTGTKGVSWASRKSLDTNPDFLQRFRVRFCRPPTPLWRGRNGVQLWRQCGQQGLRKLQLRKHLMVGLASQSDLIEHDLVHRPVRIGLARINT